MTIVVTGGGSGGHITPLLAVAHELKQQNPTAKVIFIGQRGDSLGDVLEQDANIDEIYTVPAGKFRRYHGEGLRQLLDIPTLLKNMRDFFLVLVGIWQAFWLLGKIKPDVIFVKGGFVGVPVGLAAAARRVPYITHDSDALPGLANRIVAPWAMLHTVALPKEVYRYPANRTVTVGVPLQHHFSPVTPPQARQFRKQIGVPETGKTLLVTGGGLGAKRLNDAVLACLPDLLTRYKDLTVIVLAGRAHEATIRQQCKNGLENSEQQKRVVVKGYITNLYMYSGAADVIVTRAGATSMAEFAAQAKACVVVPNPLLTGGHQIKNAKVLADRKAIRMVSEDSLRADPLSLMAPVVDLFDNPERRRQMGDRLAGFVQSDAAERLAMILLEVASTRR